MDAGQARRDFIIDKTTAFKFREIRRGKLSPRSIAVLQLRRMIYTRVIKQNGSARHSIRYLWSASERSQFFRTSWETTIQVPGTHIAFLTLTETKSTFGFFHRRIRIKLAYETYIRIQSESLAMSVSRVELLFPREIIVVRPFPLLLHSHKI